MQARKQAPEAAIAAAVKAFKGVLADANGRDAGKALTRIDQAAAHAMAAIAQENGDEE